MVQSGLRRESLPQKEFSSPADLLKWLMGVATKLRPQSQCLSQQQVEDALLDVKVRACLDEWTCVLSAHAGCGVCVCASVWSGV